LRNYLPTLDGWRAVAISLVLFCHMRLPHNFLAGVSSYGAVGVDLFFAISGFLITFRLIEEFRISGKISLQAFYIRRFFRIIPPALTYLGCMALLGLLLKLVPMNFGQIAAAALFFRNYDSMGIERGWYTGHFWSLSVEEHFYLLWPGLLVWCGLNRGRFLAPLLACGVAIWRFLDLRHEWVASVIPSIKDSVARSDYRLDGLLWGCALAFLWQSPRARGRIKRICNPVSLMVFVAGICLLLWRQPPGNVAALALLLPLCLCCTISRPHWWLARLLDASPVAWLGRISYSLYLWQQLFLPTRDLPFALLPIQQFPLNLALAVAAAAASYYLLERPLITYGRSLAARWSPASEVRLETLCADSELLAR
jgi:peptidoglycan/LPS O-acetylase OafA/YrhL